MFVAKVVEVAIREAHSQAFVLAEVMVAVVVTGSSAWYTGMVERACAIVEVVDVA